MSQPSNSYNKHRARDGYTRQRRAPRERIETLIAVYAKAREALAANDSERFLRILAVLRNSLNFAAAPKLGFHLLRIYRFSEIAVARGDWVEAERLFEGLHKVVAMADPPRPANSPRIPLDGPPKPSSLQLFA